MNTINLPASIVCVFSAVVMSSDHDVSPFSFIIFFFRLIWNRLNCYLTATIVSLSQFFNFRKSSSFHVFFYCCCFDLKCVKHRQHWLTTMAPYKAQAILVNMVDSNIVTGQSDQVDLHHQSSLNSIKWVYPLIIITSSSTAGRLISVFVCLFLFQISFANEFKKIL